MRQLVRNFMLLYPVRLFMFEINAGTDDDLPPSHYNTVSRRDRVTGNGRSVVNSAPHSRMHGDMELQIHKIEQEAYGAILRAFKAQSDALTWEKEGLITELRKELRVSDDEHRDLLNRVNADDLIVRIREWRKAGGNHNTMLNMLHPVHDLVPSPSVSGSRKRQKTSQSIPLPFGTPSQLLHPQMVAGTTQPSSTAAKWGPASGAGGKKSRPVSKFLWLSRTENPI
ncbi:unnamed protein product [Ilex paraguariensis]|uniref:ENT domain-containing protein n=1 Tax=Ilex paraguariensis TaxID=185542 RepID=A0ABC8RU12_9AQUA